MMWNLADAAYSFACRASFLRFTRPSDDEPVDPYPAITEACKPKCTAQWAKYEACGERIGKTKEGDCEAWYFDYMKCIDKCRVPQVFKLLK